MVACTWETGPEVHEFGANLGYRTSTHLQIGGGSCFGTWSIFLGICQKLSFTIPTSKIWALKFTRILSSFENNAFNIDIESPKEASDLRSFTQVRQLQKRILMSWEKRPQTHSLGHVETDHTWSHEDTDDQRCIVCELTALEDGRDRVQPRSWKKSTLKLQVGSAIPRTPHHVNKNWVNTD